MENQRNYFEVMYYLPPQQSACVSSVVHAEARGESIIGQQAVAHVILNRSKLQGKLPCIIVHQKGQFKHKWGHTYQIASNDPTGGALYFKRYNDSTKWKYHQTVRIGHHRFYK